MSPPSRCYSSKLVDYIRLLNTPREEGYPGLAVRWVQSFLTGRTTRLCFDAEESGPMQVRAEVPQGSPLSPILYLLYIAPLYELLGRRHKHIGVVGFADDTNLLALAAMRGAIAGSSRRHGRRAKPKSAWATRRLCPRNREVSESMAGSEALLEGSQTCGSREAGYASARAFKDRS